LATATEGKRPLEKPRRRWEDNIKMDLQEVGCGGMDWIELAQDMGKWRADRPSGSVKCGEFIDWLRNGQLLTKDCASWSEWTERRIV
jgi:hypothetical protein